MSLQRIRWDGTAHEFGECWRLTKRHLTAQLFITTHPLGWELRLEAASDPIRSQAFREAAPMMETAGEWRAKMIAAGWESTAPIEPVGAHFCATGWICEQHPK